MFTIRATRKLLRRLRLDPEEPSTEATNALGDWYADLLVWRPTQYVLCVNEQTLLPVVLPAAEISTLPSRLTSALTDILAHIDIPRTIIETEIAAMNEVRFARTASRKVLGTMNSFTFALEHGVSREMNCHELSLWLADTPCGAIDYAQPSDATRKLFTATLPTES